MARKPLLISHKRSPGDIVCLTALVRDIALTYPDRFDILVDTTCRDLWKHNPYATWTARANVPHNAQRLTADYGKGLREQNHETIHFCAYFHRDFERQTGIHVPVLKPHGDLHIGTDEQSPLIGGRYWCVISGGKSDFTAKVWETRKFQRVADTLRSYGLGIVQLGGTEKGHWHPPIEGALNLVGKTNLREMLRIIHQSDGIICGVTFGMHAAAALHRPCVCLAGGREAWWWEAYCRENKGLGGAAVAATLPMPHRFLHTIGLLDCCETHGCWRSKVVPLNGDKSVCKYPVLTSKQPVPKCMDMIDVDHVIEACMSYYRDDSLPPIVPGKVFSLPAPVAEKAAPPPLLVALTPAATAPITPLVPTTAGVDDRAVIDHADVGGKFTIFVLCYGDYFQLHKRCLDAIFATVPPERMDLRIGSNALGSQSLAMIEEYVAAGRVTKHYRHTENAFKYPVMREMFFDPACPITTKWVIWFDDDTIADRDPNWLFILSRHIALEHRVHNAHMFGAVYNWNLSPEQQRLFKSRPWYKGRPFRLANGKPAPNGSKTVFVAGYFWALTHEAIMAADIPDLGTGLQNNGGDWQIGEQLYQAGFGFRPFNGRKQFVHSSSVPRRGVTTPPPGKIAQPAPAANTPPPAPRPLQTAAPPASGRRGLRFQRI